MHLLNELFRISVCIVLQTLQKYIPVVMELVVHSVLEIPDIGLDAFGLFLPQVLKLFVALL